QKTAAGAALRQRPRVRAQHPAIAVHRGYCGAGFRTADRTEQERRQGQPARRSRPAPILGRHRSWSSGHRARVSRLRLVRGNVLHRKGDTFTLQYRDYPHLPKFVRHRSGIALICSADNEQPWNEIALGHLVIAQESAKDGWWEAIVIDRKVDTLTL